MAITKGIYQYDVKYKAKFNKLPSMMYENRISSQGILIQLVLGKTDIRDLSGKLLIKQNQNYTVLPYQKSGRTTYALLSDFFGIDITKSEERKTCNQFLLKDRRNDFVYTQILNELSQYFIRNEASPIEGFLHLYRILEFMSFCFPMIYASTSMNYKGSFDSLKKFFNGDTSGELKFFKKFLVALFENDPLIMAYTYSQYIDVSNISDVEKDLKRVVPQNLFNFSGNTIEFEFCNIIDIFINLRNRYFHMLVGQGTYNFYDTNYDIKELFAGLNPAFLSWLIMIFTSIEQHGVKLFS